MLRFNLLICFWWIAVVGVFAQTSPIYFVHDSLVTADKRKATSYGVYGKLSGENVWTLKKYNRWDELICTGTYKDEKLTVPHGKFVYYNSISVFNAENSVQFNSKKTDRYLFQVGAFVDGLKEGLWYEYYPNGKVKSMINYKFDYYHGDMKMFDRKGLLTFVGYFEGGKRVGNWYDVENKVVEFYKDGIMIKKSEMTKKRIRSLIQ